MGGRVWDLITTEESKRRLEEVPQPLILTYEAWTVVLNLYHHLAKLVQDETLIGQITARLSTGELVADDGDTHPDPVALGDYPTRLVVPCLQELAENLNSLAKVLNRNYKVPAGNAAFVRAGIPADPGKARADLYKQVKDLKVENERLKKEIEQARKTAKNHTPGGALKQPDPSDRVSVYHAPVFSLFPRSPTPSERLPHRPLDGPINPPSTGRLPPGLRWPTAHRALRWFSQEQLHMPEQALPPQPYATRPVAGAAQKVYLRACLQHAQPHLEHDHGHPGVARTSRGERRRRLTRQAQTS